MQNIPNKSSGDTLTGSEFSDLKNESQNAITDTGIALSGGDVNQLGKSISNYVAAGDFYNETGVADAYVGTVIGSRKGPTALVDGLRARMRVGNNNTGASTLNLNGLGVKNIAGTAGAGILVAGNLVEFEFDLAGDAWNIVFNEADTPIFNRAFTSTGQTITSAGQLILAHGLPSAPKLIQARIINTTAEFGYSVNDELIVNPSSNVGGSVTSRGLSIVPDATNITVRYGSNANVFSIIDKSTGGGVDATNANWNLIIRAWS